MDGPPPTEHNHEHQQQQQQPSEQRYLWYRIVDTDGQCFKATTLDALVLATHSRTNVLSLRKLILECNQPIFRDHVPSQLSLFANALAFKDGTTLDLLHDVDIMQTMQDAPMIVAVMCQLSQPPPLLRHVTIERIESDVNSVAFSEPFRRPSVDTAIQPPHTVSITRVPTQKAKKIYYARDALNNPIPEFSNLPQQFLCEMERVFGSTNFCYFKPKQFNGKVHIGGRINAAGPTGTKMTYANVKAICQKHHVDFENILQLQEAVNACRKVDSSVSLSGSSNCTSGNSGFSPSLAKPQPTIASKPLPIASKPPIIAPVFRAPSSAYSAAKSTTSKNSLFHALIFAYQLAGGIPTPMSALEPAIDPKFWKANGHSEFISYLVSAEEAGVVSLSHEHSDIIVSLPNQKESSHSAIPAPVQNRIFSEREVDEESDLFDEVPKMVWADDV